MITLTNIIGKKGRLANLYCAQGLLCTIDQAVCADAGLYPGCEVEEERLDELIELSQVKRAKAKALWLLSRRDYGTQELFHKLKADFPEEAAQEAVLYVKELHYLDDRRYAGRVAEMLLDQKRFSPERAVYDLVCRGIDREIAEEAVDACSPDPRESIAAVIEKKYIRCLGDEKGVRRTIAGLQRLGYRWGDIRAVLDDYVQKTAENEEW